VDRHRLHRAVPLERRPVVCSRPGYRRTQRGGVRLLVAAGWLAVIATAFVLGYLLAMDDVGRMQQRIARLQLDRDQLSEALAAAREQQIRLERSHQIDAAAKQSAQKSLERLERERLALAKRTTYLARLVREGGSGLIEITDYELEPEGLAGRYRFAFTIRQLFPEDGETTGVVKLKLEVDGQTVDAPLASDGTTGERQAGPIRLRFSHFQRVDGVLALPKGVKPDGLVVEVVPDDDRNMALEESFSWKPTTEGLSGVAVPAPD